MVPVLRPGRRRLCRLVSSRAARFLRAVVGRPGSKQCQCDQRQLQLCEPDLRHGRQPEHVCLGRNRDREFRPRSSARATDRVGSRHPGSGSRRSDGGRAADVGARSRSGGSSSGGCDGTLGGHARPAASRARDISGEAQCHPAESRRSAGARRFRPAVHRVASGRQGRGARPTRRRRVRPRQLSTAKCPELGAQGDAGHRAPGKAGRHDGAADFVVSGGGLVEDCGPSDENRAGRRRCAVQKPFQPPRRLAAEVRTASATAGRPVNPAAIRHPAEQYASEQHGRLAPPSAQPYPASSD